MINIYYLLIDHDSKDNNFCFGFNLICTRVLFCLVFEAIVQPISFHLKQMNY